MPYPVERPDVIEWNSQLRPSVISTIKLKGLRHTMRNVIASTPIDLRRISNLIAWLLFLVSTLIILHLTLKPYNFAFVTVLSEYGPSQLFYLFLRGPSDPADVVNNIVLFMPFGVGLAWLLTQRRDRWAVALAATVVLAMSLSLSVELLQLFLPTRTSTPFDVLTNTLGAGLGAILALGYRLTIRSRKHLIIALISMTVFAILLGIPFQSAAQLTGWAAGFPLIIGMREEHDNTWRGQVFDLQLAERALTDADIASLRRGTGEGGRTNLLMASYQFTGTDNYADRTGTLPNIVWRDRTPGEPRGQGVELNQWGWLEMMVPAGEHSRVIADTGQFSLLMTVATRDTTQEPAEIVSLGDSRFQRNIAVGQQGRDLLVHIHNPDNGPYLNELPRVIVPNVFSDSRRRQLIVIYNRGTIQVYIDGLRQPYAMVVSPEVALLSYLIPPKIAERSEQQLFLLDERYVVFYKAVYYALIALPLGLLIPLLSRHVLPSRKPMQRVAQGLGFALFIAVLLEIILAFAGRRLFEGQNVLTSMVLTSGVWWIATQMNRLWTGWRSDYAANLHNVSSR